MKAKPFLKWVGGKRKLVDQLISRMPSEFKTYREPFVGGGALLFELISQGKIKDASISDSNIRLIRTYTAVRDDVEGLIDRLKQYKYDQDLYYETRKKNPDTMPIVEAAAWMVYMNKTGFNGLYRVNSKNEFNVPFGRYTNPLICDEENLRACSMVLKNVQIQAQSFEKSMLESDQGDFVYCDPPYAPITATSSFTSYTSEGFGHSSQVKLRDLAFELKNRGVHVLLSNSGAPLIRDLYNAFNVEDVLAARSVNSKGDGRGKIVEVMVN